VELVVHGHEPVKAKLDPGGVELGQPTAPEPLVREPQRTVARTAERPAGRLEAHAERWNPAPGQRQDVGNAQRKWNRARLGRDADAGE